MEKGNSSPATDNEQEYLNNYSKDKDKGLSFDRIVCRKIYKNSKYDYERIASLNVTISKETFDRIDDSINVITEDLNEEINRSKEKDDQLNSALTAVENDINFLIGADENKTIREIANEELAKQLIPEDAQDSLNTLQEISDWI